MRGHRRRAGGAGGGSVNPGKTDLVGWYDLANNTDAHTDGPYNWSEFNTPSYVDGAFVTDGSARLKGSYSAGDEPQYSASTGNIAGQARFTILLRVANGGLNPINGHIWSKYHSTGWASWICQHRGLSENQMMFRVYWNGGNSYDEILTGIDLADSGDDVIACGRNEDDVGNEVFLWQNDTLFTTSASGACYNHPGIASSIAGNTNGGGEPSNMKIKTAAFYRRALSASEIAWFNDSERTYADLE